MGKIAVKCSNQSSERRQDGIDESVTICGLIASILPPIFARMLFYRVMSVNVYKRYKVRSRECINV